MNVEKAKASFEAYLRAHSVCVKIGHELMMQGRVKHLHLDERWQRADERRTKARQALIETLE